MIHISVREIEGDEWFEDHEVEVKTFSGGELHVKIPALQGSFYNHQFIVEAKLTSSDAIMALLHTVEILRRHMYGTSFLTLVIPYFPYARQDRVTEANVSFSLKQAAQLINLCEAEQVIIADPHSDVTPALINNVRCIHQASIVKKYLTVWLSLRDDNKNLVIVSPDAGAEKKASLVAKELNAPLITASKERDVATGKILKTVCKSKKIKNKNVLIVDDICDGGATFVELAKVIRTQEPKSVSLYVTHGIFSKGLGVFKGLIDNVYATDSVSELRLSKHNIHLRKLSPDWVKLCQF